VFIKMIDKNLEQLFKDGLNGYEADVNPSIWNGIQQAIQVPASPSAGNSAASNAGRVAAKSGLKGLLLAGGGAAVIGGAIIYFLSTGTPSEKPVVTENNVPAKEMQVTASQLANPQQPENSNSSAIIQQPAADKKNIAREPAATVKNTIVPVNNTTAGNAKDAAPVTPTAEPVMRTAEREKPVVNPAAPANDLSKAESKPDQKDAVKPNPEDKPAPVFDDILNYLVADAKGNKNLPNAFTPGGDAYNDVFRIGTINLKSIEITIFDQRGNKVSGWKSLDGSWDGKLSDGKDAPSGTYFYTINAESNDGKICIGQSVLYLLNR